MTEQKASMNVRKVDDHVCVIEIHGAVTAFSEDALMEAYTQASNGNTKAVILDFNNLDYMNSSGIGLLVTLLIRANRHKQKVLAVGLNDHYQQIFELTRLDEAISIYDNEDQALQEIA